MKKIITISREYGSGGREIGKEVAKSLGYEFYDKELIDLAAQESGLSADYIEKTEQTISSSFLYNIVLGSSYSVGSASAMSGGANQILPLPDQIFNAQRKVILRLASEKPCVIVGRCADYILSSSEEINKKDLFNIFIYADIESRIERAVKQYGLAADDAKKIILQIDKRRANHYNTFTENTWGKRSYYDLLINSALLGVENTANIICEMAKK